MSQGRSDIGWHFGGRWLIATIVAWVVGLLGAIVLSALIVNLVYPKETNLIVGLCVGAAVGYAQIIAARPWITLRLGWMWGAMIAMGIPFVVAVGLDEVGLGTTAESGAWVLGIIAVLSGLTGGALQARALRHHTPRASWWVPVAMATWGLAWLGDGAIGFPAGGAVLGVLGGGSLVWFLRAGGPIMRFQKTHGVIDPA